jgi:serine/threonine protein kinase
LGAFRDSGSPSERVGPYRLEEPLGRGGMGTVWRAWDERLQRQVAAKQFRADTAVSHIRARLRREARTAARLNHPAIVQIYDIVEEEGGDWIIMELVRGQTLRQWLDEQGPLSPAMASRLGGEIAEGLAEAHAAGILHRDLKAGNVMVTPAGRAKILDFGLAKDVSRVGAEQDLTFSTPGTVVGTTYAMSPEQVLGHDLDPRSDLFSFGSLLYEALTGDPPFRGDSPTASLSRVLSYRPPPLREVVPGLPRELSDLVELLLEKELAGRPGSAREVVRALAALAVGEGGAYAGEPLRLAPPDESNLGTFAQSTTEATAPWQEPPSVSLSDSAHRRTLSERRLLTVVCCGLVEQDEGSGAVGFLELEALSENMASLQRLAREVSERHSGSLSTTPGHVLWLYFGYPHVHEDDVQRAVRTARELMDRIGEIERRPGPRGERRLALRVAIHTGPAVVSGAGPEERLQLGAVLDLATSLQSASPTGQVLVSEASRKLIERDFTTEPLPAVRVPGVGEPVAVHRVLGAIEHWDQGSGESTLLVGREREIELLEDRFRLAGSGMGQAVMIVGEAGIGKSRLVKALRERLATRAPVWWFAHGSPATQNSPLAPLLELLDRIVSGSGEISRGGKRGGFERFLEGSPGHESLPSLADLLSLLTHGGHPPLDASPEAQRKRAFEALVALLAELAERQVLVLVVEDLHWIDPSTLEFLDLLLNEISALPLLLIATYRPELKAPWGHRGCITQLALSRLNDEEAVCLIDRLTGEGEMPDNVRQQIRERTDGVPLFIEEMTKAVLEGWTRRWAEIPTTLGGSLAARFDRLGAGKEVAQIASVIGRVFSPELLREIAPLAAEAVERGLAELVQAELVHRRGAGPRARYTFKHALIQDAAYACLLARDRQELHLRIAQFLEEKIADADRVPLAQWLPPESGNSWQTLLAHHWSQASDPQRPVAERLQKALAHLIAAGEHALHLCAYREASVHFESALEILPSLPEGEERDRQELVLQTRKGTVLKAIQGWGTPEVTEVYQRARDLCRKLGDRRELAQVLFGLWAAHFTHAEYEAAIQLAEEHLEEARHLGPAEVAMAHNTLANTLLAVCRLPECLLHAETAAALAEGLDENLFRVEYGEDPRIVAAAHSCWVFWQIGLDEEALARLETISRVAERLAHPFNLTLAASTSMWLHRQRHAAQATLAGAERLLEVAKTIGGFPDYETAAEIFRDWALAELGQASAVVDAVLQNLERYSRARAKTAMASFYAIGAEVCRLAGRREDALALLDRGMTALENGGLLAEVELCCLRGEILGELACQAGAGLGGELRREAPAALRREAQAALRREAQAALRREAEAALSRAFDLACERWQVAYLDRALCGLARFPGDRSREIGRAERLRAEVPHLLERVRDRVATEMASHLEDRLARPEGEIALG